MNFLFLTDEFYPEFGANSLIVKTISEELTKMGNRVYVAPFSYSEILSSKEEWNGITVIRNIPYDSKKALLKAIKSFRLIQAIRLFGVIFLSKICGPHSLVHKKKILARSFLERFIKENNIDTVVTINCSVELAFPILYLKKHEKINAKWIFYMLDPFESHEYYRKHHSVEFLRKLQHKIMRFSDSIFATDLIYKDTEKWESKDILKKIKIVEFPKIEEPKELEGPQDILLDKEYINVLCTGSKNEQVRNSAYVLKLCEILKNESVKFHFIGNGWADEDIYTEGNCIFYPPQSWQTVRNLQLKADFLLNIGNSNSNQLPSKVLEYISSGKPIINSYKSKICPTLSILEKYDAINIYEDDNIEVSLKNLEEYLKLEHRTISFQEIKSIYPEYTPTFVAKQFLEI